MSVTTALRLARVLHKMEAVRLALKRDDLDKGLSLLAEAYDELDKLRQEEQ